MWKRVLLTCLKYNDWKADTSCFISWTESQQALWCSLGQTWELPSLHIIPSPSLSSQRFKCLVLTYLLPSRDLFMLSDVDLLFYPLLCLPVYNSFSENCVASPPQKKRIKNRTEKWYSSLFLGTCLKQTKVLRQREICTLHRIFPQNHQGVETTQVSMKRWMNEENIRIPFSW